MHSNHTNNLGLNTAALMRNYISPGTSTAQAAIKTIKTHPNTLTTRQIKLEVCVYLYY